MSAVIQDPDLFHSLLACLRVPSEQDGSNPAATFGESNSHVRVYHTAQNQNSSAQQMSRKRTLSFSGGEVVDSNPHKSLKTHHSPVPAMSKKAHHSHSHGKDKRCHTVGFDIRVIAATVLYTAFEQIDHWPAPLVQVYAEDCFGPRLWVDDENCALLVQNLSLTHSSDADIPLCGENSSDILLEEARMVSSFYKKFKSTTVISSSREEDVAERPRLPSTGSFEEDQVSICGSLPEPPKEVRTVTATSYESDSGDDDGGFLEISAGSVTVNAPLKANDAGEDDSSSSGESEMEVVQMTASFVDGETSGSNTNGSRELTPPPSPLRSSYPAKQKFLNNLRIRQRYFGENLRHAHLAISDALSNRLDTKSKQNSRLLSCLPAFASLPEVRRLTSRHLERWLQSPALSGPARALFAATVSNMQNLDPPLPADIEAIDSILRMQLKVNQLNAHVENVTAIAKNIPNAAVSRQLFLRLMRSELEGMDSINKDQVTSSSMTDQLRMIAAIRSVTSSSLAADAIATALLTILANPIEEEVGMNSESITLHERHRHVEKIRQLLRRLAAALGPQFDSCQIVESLLSFDVDVESWSVNDEEDKGRLMFECVTLLAIEATSDSRLTHSKGQRVAVPHVADKNASGDQISSLQKKLVIARKMMLTWCCSDYAPMYQETCGTPAGDGTQAQTLEGVEGDSTKPVGAGTPNFSSILHGDSKHSICLNTMRCVLFMEEPESPLLYSFLYPGGLPGSTLDTSFSDERSRIKCCCQYGADLDNEMMSIVIRSASSGGTGLDPEMALTLLEHLFYCCRKGQTASLQLSEPQLVWDLYTLVEFMPTLQRAGESAHHCGLDATKNQNGAYKNLISGVLQANSSDEIVASNAAVLKEMDVPRLAYPGMWWRATSIALIMCGVSPNGIGAVMSLSHPTLQSLIKMVTSNRYRFPTVDCDDQSRDAVKKSEADLKDMELRVTEFLFFAGGEARPKKRESKEMHQPSNPRGSRASARQRAKQERILKLKREKEEAKALAEAKKRRNEVRAALKSIMLWDPRVGARRPPPESVSLIHSAEELFGLAEIFQQSVKPDFILMTIGKTCRQSIERAYDWLIPVTSSHPEIINRLPSSASCFLLLRAYGAEGGGSAELRKLSSPLLTHVRESLTGKFGEQDAVRAAELLLADVADQHPDRRRCARRVLQEALSGVDDSVDDEKSKADDCAWLFSIVNVKHASALVSDCIQFISRGLAFERGRVLRAFVLALNTYMNFAEEHSISGCWDFASIVYTLVSSRHNVYSEAMDRYADLRALTVTTIQKELHMFLGTLSAQKVSHKRTLHHEATVQIVLCVEVENVPDLRQKPVALPFSLMHASCVLLSNWRDQDEHDPGQHSTKSAIRNISSLFLCGDDADATTGTRPGLQGAAIVSSGQKAVTVDQWVMLAKSRSDYIARRAALSAPATILPRLLLCSGLPRASLSTMFERVEELGHQSSDPSNAFGQLLTPSATGDWGVSFVGSKRDVACKLRGRLSAYFRAQHIESSHYTTGIFMHWLNEECQNPKKGRKSRTKKPHLVEEPNLGYLSSMTELKQILPDLTKRTMPDIGEELPIMKGDVDDIVLDSSGGTACVIECPTPSCSKETVQDFITLCFKHDHIESLENYLQGMYNDSMVANCSTQGQLASKQYALVGIATFLVEAFSTAQKKHEEMEAVAFKWVPLLSRSVGSKDLWSLLFETHFESQHNFWTLLLVRCASIWSEDHMGECRTWILTPRRDEAISRLSPKLMTKFLVLTAPQESVHLRTFSSTSQTAELPFTEEEATAGAVLALKCMKNEGSDEQRLNARDDIPDWLLLLLIVARPGKKQMKCITDIIIEQSSEAEASFRRFLCSTVLRLYAYFPGLMELRNAALRSLLVEATDALASVWIRWRSPFDEQVEDMLTALRTNPNSRLIQALGDMAKDYPLLLLRKMARCAEILNQDAGDFNTVQQGRGRIQTGDLGTELAANLKKKTVKVTVRHWGCSFSESLWVSMLEIVLLVPQQVLFFCGLSMGFTELLNVYLRLSYLQHLSGEQSKSTRLRGRLVELLSKFHSSNGRDWDRWTSSPLKDITHHSSAGDILSICDMQPHSRAIKD